MRLAADHNQGGKAADDLVGEDRLFIQALESLEK